MANRLGLVNLYNSARVQLMASLDIGFILALEPRNPNHSSPQNALH
jgi:hypothetical protein